MTFTVLKTFQAFTFILFFGGMLKTSLNSSCYSTISSFYFQFLGNYFGIRRGSLVVLFICSVHIRSWIFKIHFLGFLECYFICIIACLMWSLNLYRDLVGSRRITFWYCWHTHCIIEPNKFRASFMADSAESSRSYDFWKSSNPSWIQSMLYIWSSTKFALTLQ